MVGAWGNGIVIKRPPLPDQLITKQEALLFAAWIVALAEDTPGDFQRVLDAVRAT